MHFFKHLIMALTKLTVTCKSDIGNSDCSENVFSGSYYNRWDLTWAHYFGPKLEQF